MTYAVAKATKDRLEAEASAASDALNAVSGRGPMGLTPDSVKRGEEWRTLRDAYAGAAQRLRDFNKWFLREHGRAYQAERRVKA